MLLRYCLSDFEMVPVAGIITGTTFAFTFHVRLISIIRSLHSLAISSVTSTMCPRRKIKQNFNFLSQIIYLQ